MSLIDSPMISGDNNDAVFINTRFLDGIHNTAHIAVQFFQFGIISRSIVSVTVPYVVRVVETESTQHRFLLHNILTGHVTQSRRMRVIVGCLRMMVQSQRIYQILDAIPFIQYAHLGIGSRLAQLAEHGGENAMLVQHTRR